MNSLTPDDRKNHERLHTSTALLLAVLEIMTSGLAGAAENADRPAYLIGYTEGRNDLPEGQFANWVTNRACVVRADGSGRRVLAEELSRKQNSWTQFGGWSPDGKQAVILTLWESPENAAWEREHKTFRMTEGWLVDTCLLDLVTGKITNLTAVHRISIYNTGLFSLPDGSGYGFTPLINGISKPHVMDLDGRNKRDVSGAGGGFAYGYSASPDGKQITYHENYQIYVSNVDGSRKRRIETGNPFNFVPQWSPDGEWLLFVSGEHYNCHPHVVKKDGTGLRKLADRGGYRGVVERLKHPDFHSESSDVPIWAKNGTAVYYTAKVDASIEIMRVTLDGKVEQLTRSAPGVRHYHPGPSPDGRWVLFGSDRSGVMQLYVARADGSAARPVTAVPAGACAMHGHWQPIGVTRPGVSETATSPEKPTGSTPHVVNRQGATPKPIVAIDKVCAWPNLMSLRDGTIVATIHNQPSHLQRPADVECWASQNGGMTWSKRGVPAPRDDREAARGMFAAGVAPNGDLVVLSTGHANTLSTRSGWGPVTPTWISRSSDGGKTWSIDKTGFPTGPDGKVLNPFGDIVVGKDGELRAAVYGDTNAVGALVFRSRDNGRTWTDPVRISRNKRSNETALLHLGGGLWLAAARNTGTDLYSSEDDAATWKHRPIGPDPQGRIAGDNQHPAHLLRLSSGTIVLAYGNRTKDSGVDARLSNDDGKTWSAPYRVLDCAGDLGYPSSVQRADGQVVTAYYASRIDGHQDYHMGIVIWDPAKTHP